MSTHAFGPIALLTTCLLASPGRAELADEAPQDRENAPVLLTHTSIEPAYSILGSLTFRSAGSTHAIASCLGLRVRTGEGMNARIDWDVGAGRLFARHQLRLAEEADWRFGTFDTLPVFGNCADAEARLHMEWYLGHGCSAAVLLPRGQVQLVWYPIEGISLTVGHELLTGGLVVSLQFIE